MGQPCCNTAPLSALRIDQPKPRAIPAADAHCFAPTRAKLWELPELLHCSVIGTCLSTADLRKRLAKLNLARPGETDHDLHSHAVALASQNAQGGRLLNKLLDTSYDLAIRQFARAADEPALIQLWQQACARGDIPGPYWALLTHPAVSYALRRTAFGHVHMLSHLVGAANRADIRRLAALEATQAALKAEQDRLHDQLQTVQAERDRALNAQTVPLVIHAPDQASAQRIAELERRLAAETGRREAAEARAAALDQQASLAQSAHQAAEADRTALAEALAAAEAALDLHRPGVTATLKRLDGQSLLYVGGRPHQVTAMRTLSASLGATLRHHDGGVDEQIGLLAGLVARADTILFPVDCISHEAALAIKRLCRQAGKPFIPLRSTGYGAFLAAIAASAPSALRVAAA